MKRTDPADLQWLALSLSPNIGAQTLNNLLRHFHHDFHAIFAASPVELQRVRGIGPRIASEIAAIDLSAFQRDLCAWRAAGLAVLRHDAADYPEPLRRACDAPPALFALGDLQNQLWAKSVAIVGTRAPSQEARFLTLQLAMKLARAGYTIVSGLALGIDTAAHVSALTAGGVTVAVLGSGLLNVYPEVNRPLAEQIRRAGALLSEAHPPWGANAQRLVSRNRIISGLAQAVIVVESQVDGGAMYTARFASEQGRPVYTFDLPAGGNQALIRGGAPPLRRDDPLESLLG